MVKIAISGASGNVAQEILDVLVATEKHEIILLSRKEIPVKDLAAGVTSVIADYTNQDQLVQTLTGVHTVLCFITSQSDEGSVLQKALIDACVKAGVKRYAPSEWGSSGFDHMPWYAGKAEVREYLAAVNKDTKVLEYCLFHAGLFVNYMAAPYKTSKHVHPFQMHFDFNGRRAIVTDDMEKGRINFVTISDFCETVAKAIEFEREWPRVGGIKGDAMTVKELIAMGERIRGPFKVEPVPVEDLKQNIVKTSWLPTVDHPVIPPDQRGALAAGMVSGFLLGISAGAFEVSDEWNKLLPGRKFTAAEEFLTKAWEGKP